MTDIGKIIRSYVNEHYHANWNFFTGRAQRIFLWNVFISVRRSWCYSSWWSKLSRSLCLNSYFISNSNIFFTKRHNKLTLTSIDSQVYYWRADRRHQRHVSRLRHIFQSPYYLSARFARPFFFSPTPTFFLFPLIPNLVPGYNLVSAI